MRRGTVVSKMGEMVDFAVVRLPSLFTNVGRCQCDTSSRSESHLSAARFCQDAEAGYRVYLMTAKHTTNDVVL